MLEHIDLIAKTLMSMGVIALTTWQVWGLTVTVRDMVKSVKDNEKAVKANQCSLSALEKSILVEIRALQQIGREAGRNADRRFDSIERKVHHIYGLLDKTIPPND